MENDIQKILITKEEIAKKIEELGKKISKDYKDKDLLLVSVLKGSVVFMADIMRAISITCDIDFMSVSSYGSKSVHSGVVRIIKDLDVSIKGKDVLIIEDILDSGQTLRYIIDMLSQRNPASIKVCTFLDKPERRQVDLTYDYLGFTVPDHFIVGYGLDYNQLYRNLPYVGILKPEKYK